MKHLTILVFLILAITASAQTFQGQTVKFEVDKWNISVRIEKQLSTQEVQAFFSFIDHAFGRSLKDRYLITPDGIYYRAGLSRKKPKRLDHAGR